MNTHPDLSTHVNEKLITPFRYSCSLENMDRLVGMKVVSATPLELGVTGAKIPSWSLLTGNTLWGLGTHLPCETLLCLAAASCLLHVLSSHCKCYTQNECTDPRIPSHLLPAAGHPLVISLFFIEI